jgi:DNA-binding transcriptional LysR family regulator
MSKANRSSFRLDTDLISLRALVAITDEGSFSAAARKIGRTQSAVSLQIAKLEDRVRARLFERTSRRVRQTTDGEILTAYARRILDLADEAMTALSAPEVAAPFRVGFPEHLAPQLLHDLLARFQRAHPKVMLELRLGPGPDLHQRLQQDRLDVVISGPEGEGEKILLTEPLVWVGSPAYRGNADEPLRLILIQPPCSYRKATLDALAAANLPWRMAMESSSIQAVQTAVGAGLGVSAMARSAVTRELRILHEGYPELPPTCMAAYVRPNTPHPLADRFIAFLEEGLDSSETARR